jgi:hypothetical protein
VTLDSTGEVAERLIVAIRNRPVTSFLLVTCAVSYVLGIPFNIIASSIFDSSSLAGIYVPRVVTVIGPAVAATVVALAGGGVISVSRLFGSLRLHVGDIAPPSCRWPLPWLRPFSPRLCLLP